MFMMSFIFVVIRGVVEWKRIYAVLSFVYICIAIRDIDIKSVGIPLTVVTPSHVRTCVLSQDLDFVFCVE